MKLPLNILGIALNIERPLCWQCAFEAYLATAMIKCTGSLPGASLWTMELSTGAKH